MDKECNKQLEFISNLSIIKNILLINYLERIKKSLQIQGILNEIL